MYSTLAWSWQGWYCLYFFAHGKDMCEHTVPYARDLARNRQGHSYHVFLPTPTRESHILIWFTKIYIFRCRGCSWFFIYVSAVSRDEVLGDQQRDVIIIFWATFILPFYARAPKFDTQCTLNTASDFGTLALNWQNTSSPKYNDDIILADITIRLGNFLKFYFDLNLNFQCHIKGTVQRDFLRPLFS